MRTCAARAAYSSPKTKALIVKQPGHEYLGTNVFILHTLFTELWYNVVVVLFEFGTMPIFWLQAIPRLKGNAVKPPDISLHSSPVILPHLPSSRLYPCHHFLLRD